MTTRQIDVGCVASREAAMPVGVGTLTFNPNPKLTRGRVAGSEFECGRPIHDAAHRLLVSPTD